MLGECLGTDADIEAGPLLVLAAQAAADVAATPQPGSASRQSYSTDRGVALTRIERPVRTPSHVRKPRGARSNLEGRAGTTCRRTGPRTVGRLRTGVGPPHPAPTTPLTAAGAPPRRNAYQQPGREPRTGCSAALPPTRANTSHSCRRSRALSARGSRGTPPSAAESSLGCFLRTRAIDVAVGLWRTRGRWKHRGNALRLGGAGLELGQHGATARRLKSCLQTSRGRPRSCARPRSG